MRSRRTYRTAVTFAAALLGAAALASSAAASAFPGANGPVVFAHGTAAGQTIWITNPDGSGAHALTSPPSGFFDASPRFSADGGWVTFERSGFKSGSSFGYTSDHVMVMRSDGSCVTDLSGSLAGTPLADGSPSFAPDGSYVVFTRLNLDNDQFAGILKETVSLNCGGGAVGHGTATQLTAGRDTQPTISADGTRLAFVRESSTDLSIYVAPVSNPGAAQQVTHPGQDDFDSEPDFSPDGTKIVFNRDGDTWVTKSDGSTSPTILVPHAAGVFNAWPAFSPDGSRVVFQRATGVGPGGSPGYGLYTVSSSGGTPTVIPGQGGGSTASNQHPDWGVPAGSGGGTPPTYLESGSFVIGDGQSKAGTGVTYWGAQWWKDNTVSGGGAPASFKGFADDTSTRPPTCGGAWTTRPGNSSKPPASVPEEMAVIVTGSVHKSGSTISGTIEHIVVVKTNAGYGPNPGHAGTGKVTRVVC
ncbi:MAG: TolB protein [Thermoleophilaceae bacterium]|nr:TolB protein [Thermoleophilaceae bacterium]